MKIKIISLFWLVLLILAVVSCDKMNDMHQSYLDDGEKIYAAQVDSVAPHGGDHRVELEMFIFSQRVEKVRVYWNDDSDSTDVMINNQVGIFKEVISGLEEGEMIFNLVSFDKFGNVSLKYEVIAQNYGDIYITSLVNRAVSDMTFLEDTLVVNWRTIGSHVGTNFSYLDSTGNLQELFVPDTVGVTKLTDYEPEGEYWATTLYIPEEAAIDTFETAEPATGVFPPLPVVEEETE